MFMSELDTFVMKFKHLYFEGYEAHQNLESHAGKVWVGMHVQLGDARGPPHPHHQQHERQHLPRRQHAANGPSRQRRRAKREAARQQSNDVANDEVSVEDSDTKPARASRENVVTNIVEVLEDNVIDISIDIADEETANEDVEETEFIVIDKSKEIVVEATANGDIEDTDDNETKDNDVEET